ncbi:exonuclease SbcC [Lacrimispora xylanisolvens]|uniref:Exonuclease SbcC n=1 Tax=Lacrimispora xylanisolvens TaxID=384636 RepID=A0A2S6HSV0_9FIRM|nr:hypothetical protein [Hungatella xylanolytica]PPK80661.1 exonuclease SbcC [Hungatella xylanolytica]
MIKLQNIKIANFRAFGQPVSFYFGGKSLVLLTAPNGKGKTSLLDAVEWCFTGDIVRLHRSYAERNPGAEGTRKGNEEAILKNKYYLSKPVRVELQLDINHQTYTIVRLQQEDTLNTCGSVKVNNKEGEEAELLLKGFIDKKNFYKYHVCDMQKTFHFLHTGRSGMSQEFADFTTDHSIAENVAANLDICCEDINNRIKNVPQVSEETIRTYRDALEKHEKSPEILPYDNRLLYPAEQTVLRKMTTEELNEQLRALYRCGYARITTLLERKAAWEDAKYRKKELEVIRNEFVAHSSEIVEAVKLGVSDPVILRQVKDKLKRYNEITLDTDNLAGYSEEILNINNNLFTLQYWEESINQQKNLKIQKEMLTAEVEILKKGNEIIDALTTITTGKRGLVHYRSEKRKVEPNQPVLCPVCGSELFDTIEEAEITKLAQNYQSEQRELIEEKKLGISNLTEQLRLINTEQLTNAKRALQSEIDKIQEYVDKLERLNNVTNAYFGALEKLREIDSIAYEQEKMLSYDGINEEIEKIDVLIPAVECTSEIENEANRLLSLVFYSNMENLTGNTLLENIRFLATGVPDGVMYNEDLLRSKIASMRSHIQNFEYLDAVKKLKEAVEINLAATQKIEKLKELSTKVKERAEQIRTLLKKMNAEEYNQVGPYLYKIFRKLTRDMKVAGINLKGGKGNGLLAVVDDQNKPILNMLSDGQLSVFMLSYFLGNALRLKAIDPFSIYFVDDITSCMDDINMLAFLDFIKYQLSSKNSAIDQLFFSTCDTRIQDMLRYKCDQCDIDYAEIGIEKFES